MLEIAIRYFSNLISCSIGMFIIIDFMNQIFSFAYADKRIQSIIKLVGTLLWFFVNYFEFPLLNFSYCIVSIFIIAFFFYNVKNIKEILQLIIFIIAYAASDIIVSSLISLLIGYLPFYSNHSIIYLLNVLVAQTIIIFTIKVLIILLKRQNKLIKNRKKYILLFAFPISNVVTVYTILILPTYSVNSSSIYYIIILMTIISIILNIALIYLFESEVKADQFQNDLKFMRQQVDMQYNYYQKLETEYNNYQKIMHDIKNHLSVLERLYHTEMNGTAGFEYTQKISSMIDQLGMKFKSNNKILNIIINEKMKVCESYQIKFIYSVENVNLDFICDIDITLIFANILDNAIEACQKIESGNRQIEFRLYKFNNMIVIGLSNTTHSYPSLQEGEYISTKRNHKAIGLSNVKACVNKYNGDINIGIEQGKFSVSIILPLDESC